MAFFEFLDTYHLAIMIGFLSVAVVMVVAGVLVIRANPQWRSDDPAVERKRRNGRALGMSYIRIGVVLAFVIGFLLIMPPAVNLLIEGQ